MPQTEKLDLYKQRKTEYVAPKTPTLVTVRPATYLTITGKGEPGGEVFTAKLGALYVMAYAIKFAKKSAGRDYKVCGLEGLWWGTRKRSDFFDEPREEWKWKLLIRTPDFVSSSDLDQAVAALLVKGKGPEVKKVELETIDEGLCVQVLHVGPYSNEPQTIALMKEFIAQKGLVFRGVHHEVYVSDPKRVAEGKLRTILRRPVRVVAKGPRKRAVR